MKSIRYGFGVFLWLGFTTNPVLDAQSVAVDVRPVPDGFVLIPAGEFIMGDALDGLTDAPTHTVNVSGFYMAKYELTKALWDEVRTWGAANGYTDLPTGSAPAPNHPLHSIDWYATVKWCNARSQKEGLVPCYTVSGSVYQTGSAVPDCHWGANGYRLPTEAEWEKSARGGLEGKRFSWGDVITHREANYLSSTSYNSGVGSTLGYHPIHGAASAPVGSFAANGYGLHDMSGNVCEWCWDGYGAYDVTAGVRDPRGSSGSTRVGRGGSWSSKADYSRVAGRHSYAMSFTYHSFGFRVARSLVP